MPHLTADICPDPEIRTGNCSQHGDYSLCLFSDGYLASLYPAARGDLRTKARGIVALTHLIQGWQQSHALHPSTGVYLSCSFGPYSLRTQQAVLAAPPEQRLSVLERTLPPKDYFIATPAMKAAQLSIEFALHGPVMALFHADYGLEQAFALARSDLMDGVVEAALVGGVFSLDDPAEVPHHLSASSSLCEAVFFQYASSPGELMDSRGPAGRFGPLTSIIERNPPSP